MIETSETSEKLTAIGDALAKGIELAQAMRSWMRTVERSEIEAVLDAVSPADAENVQRAVVRIALSRGWSPASIAGFDTLRKSALAKSVANDAHEPSHASDGPLPEGLADAATPDDEVVTAYVLHGALARYVEGVAARNPGFSEELLACIDALDQAEAKVGDKARAWQKLVRGEAEAAPANVVPLVAIAQVKKQSTGISMYFAPIALAASVVLVATGAFVYHQHTTQLAAEQAANEQARRDEEKRRELDKLMKELDEQNKAIQIAQNEAALAKSEAEKQLAMAKLQAAQEQQRRTAAGISAVRAGGGTNVGAGNPGSPVRAKPACTCQAGDPLCSCL